MLRWALRHFTFGFLCGIQAFVEATNVECNFENGVCSFSSDCKSGDCFAPIEARLADEGPAIDHTTGKGDGWYARAQFSRNAWSESVARLGLEATGPFCFSAWLHASGLKLPRVELVSRQQDAPWYVEEDDKERIFYRAQFSHSGLWQKVLYQEERQGNMQLEIRAWHFTGGSVAVDDLNVTAGLCPADPEDGSCTFDRSKCGYENAVAGTGNMWKIIVPGRSASRNQAETLDHTTDTIRGGYVNLLVPANTTASRLLSSPVLNPPNVQQRRCLRFFYFAPRSEQHSGLELVLSTNLTLADDLQTCEESTIQPLWGAHNDSLIGGAWMPVEASFMASEAHQIHIRGYVERARNSSWFCALDDIEVYPCSHREGERLSCKFDSGDLCNWTASHEPFSATPTWKLSDSRTGQPHLPEQPHSKPEGGFVYAENRQQEPALKAVLTSPSWDSVWVGAACLTFWHCAVFERPGSCNLTVSGGPGHVWWSSTHELSRSWKSEVIRVWLQNDQDKFSLEASLSQALIAVDDITLSFGACPSEQRGLSCDFEQGPCTWTNPVGKKRNWEWLLRGGNLNTAIPQPPRDHTLSTPEGSFMLVSGREMQFGGTAELQSEVVDLRSPGTQCLDFWYAAHGTRKDRLELKVTVQKSTSDRDVYREQVWYHKGGNTTAWQLGRIKVPRGHRVAFEAAVLKSPDGYIALDDISIYINENCLTEPAEAKTGKAAYDILECLWNTPSGCLWSRPSEFMGSWKLGSRSPPTSALAPATSPDGKPHNFVYASCKSVGSVPSASLISPSVPTQPTPVCLRFAFYMFGPGSRELQLVLRTRQASPADPSANSLLFAARGGTVADRWYDVARTVSFSSSSTELEFRAPSDKCKQGDIFLSDIHVTPGACNEAYDGRGLCDFEQDTCGWKNNGWRHVFTGMRGDMARASRLSGPANSLGYLQLAWFRGAVNRATLSSPLWSGYHRPRTLELWYYADLTANSSLEAHLVDKNGSLLSRVWTLPRAAPVRTWSLARAEIPLQATDFRVEIEGRLNPRSNNVTVICVDDVLLDLARPSHVADCDFDQDLCGYVSSFDSDFRWLVGSGRVFRSQPGSQVSQALMPSGAGGPGRFAYADATLAPETPSTMTLRSPIFNSNGNGTLFMRYFRNGTAFQSFQVHQLLLLSSGERRLLLADLSSADEWQHVALPLHPADESQLEISLVGAPSQGQGLAAIAKIRVTPGATDVPDGAEKPSVDLSCDFEGGNFCLWKPDMDVTAQLQWSLNDPAKGRPTFPLFDHTTRSANGSFIFAENNGSTASVARIKSPTLPRNSTSSSLCISFWYFTLTDRNSSLNVTVVSSSSDSWFEPGARVVAWAPAQAHFAGLAAVNDVQVVIEASIPTGLVALDDLSMTVGSCPMPSLCTFEGGTECGHSPDMNNARDWEVRQGSYLDVPDHTTGSQFGHYLYLNTTSARQGRNSFSRLYLPVRHATAGACLTLWWRAHGEENKINVYRFVQGAGLREVVHSLDTEETLWWNGHSVNIASDEPYQVVLEALIPDIATTESGVLLDDIELVEGKCPNQNTCTFEGPTCLLWQDPQDSFATGQWKQQRAGLSVHPRDHTTGTAQGHYMRFSADTPGQFAVLTAGGSDGPRCASLWYQLSEDLQGMALLLGAVRLNETTHGQWQPAQFSLTREYGSIIAISGSNPKAFALIDDLLVQGKDCAWQGGGTDDAAKRSSTATVPASTTTTPLSSVYTPSHTATRTTALLTATPQTAATSSPKPTCGYGMFSCRDSKHCVPALLLCDGVKDCPNGADEICGGVELCPVDYYYCRQPPTCLHKSNLCDGQQHCTDGSDEILCDGCPSYFCLNGGNCSLHPTSRAPGCACKPGFYGNRCQMQSVEKPSHDAQTNAAGGTGGWAYIAPLLVLLILGFTTVVVFYVRRKRANDAQRAMDENRQVVVENPIYGLALEDEDTTSRNSRQSVESWFSRTFRFSNAARTSTSEC